MSLNLKKDSVALSILGVYTPSVNYGHSLRSTGKDIIFEQDIEDLARRRRHQILSSISSQSRDPDNIDKRRPGMTLFLESS